MDQVEVVKAKVGVKELLEAVEALGEIARVGAAIAADKKLSIEDIQHLLAADKTKIMEGVKGVNECGSEIKDLDLDEAMVVIKALVEAVRQVKVA